MIDQDIIENLESGFRKEVEWALKMLVISGVIDIQKARLKDQLVVGNPGEPLPLVAQSILDFRMKYQALESLEYLGQQYEHAQLIVEDDNA